MRTLILIGAMLLNTACAKTPWWENTDKTVQFNCAEYAAYLQTYHPQLVASNPTAYTCQNSCISIVPGSMGNFTPSRLCTNSN